MTIATIKKVNKAIAYLKVEMVKGDGYFYFMPYLNAPEDHPFIESLYVNSIKDLSLEEWVHEVEPYFTSGVVSEKVTIDFDASTRLKPRVPSEYVFTVSTKVHYGPPNWATYTSSKKARKAVSRLLKDARVITVILNKVRRTE